MMSRATFALALCLQFSCVLGVSQEDASARSGYYVKIATEYKVTCTDAAPNQKELTACDLTRQPLMSWTSLQDYDGCIFSWTRNGRPVALATIFSGPGENASRRRVYHEFVSFAEQPLRISGPNGNSWSPEPLTKWTLVPDDPTVGKTTPQLKLQARNLAKQFTASLNRLGETWELRLLPKPLCEYGSVDQTTKCGAIFAFVAYSTDPEILLMLEARETPEGTHWYYVPGRSSNKSLFLNYRGDSIWKSLRQGHGSTENDQEDTRYKVLHVGSEEAATMLKQP